MRRATLLCAVVLLAVMSAGCGEPAVDLTIPDRPDGEHVADLAGVLDTGQLQARLDEVANAGTDIVALTFETEQASCGEAFRAGSGFVAQWEADIAIVAVAKPGDFTSTEDNRVRCLGVQPLEQRSVPADVREHIAEELVPPLTADNDWTGAFMAAIDALAQP